MFYRYEKNMDRNSVGGRQRNAWLACTGISSTARDGGYVQARTIEWGIAICPASM